MGTEKGFLKWLAMILSLAMVFVGIACGEPVALQAGFTVDVQTGTAPLTVHFQDQSIGNVTSINWYFGDPFDSTSSEKNPTFTYDSPGTYTVTQTVIEGDIASDTMRMDIVVKEQEPKPKSPVASFSANPTGGEAPLVVQFTDTSIRNPETWKWNFGDGTADSTLQNPEHTFEKAGTFIVELTVTNAYGSGSTSSNIIVTGESAEPILPEVGLECNVTEGVTPLTVQFTDGSSYATEREWDFGDGNKSSEKDPVHTFWEVKTYTVTLTASNENGSRYVDRDITVNEKTVEPDPDPEPVLILPTADFTTNLSSGFAPLTVQFTDKSENATRFQWDFGDDITTEVQNPIHTYTVAGTYEVGFTAANMNGSAYKAGTIVVKEAEEDPVEPPVMPVAKIKANVTSGEAPLAVQFEDLSSNSTERVWDFGDGSSSEAADPIHIFEKGNFTVTLIASNGNGTSTDTEYIIVTEKSVDPEPLVMPVASFDTDVLSGYAPLTVQFTDTSEDVNAWRWSFGDGDVSVDRNPVHTYTAVGTYTVTLTVSNDNGTDDASAHIIVNKTEDPVEDPDDPDDNVLPPVARFEVNKTEGEVPFTIAFTDKSENAARIEWDFDDGNNSSETSPVYTFTTVGVYKVVQEVSNLYGRDNETITITVKEKSTPIDTKKPVANFTSNTTGGYAPLAVKFTDCSENALDWQWEFGDGSTSKELNPTHIYTKAGNYTVNLIVSNGLTVDSATMTITVKESVSPISVLPEARFTSNITTGFAPLTVEFKDVSLNATSRVWNFGDGTRSTEKNPVHTYLRVGVYTAILTVTNENGTDSESVRVEVQKKAGSDDGGSGDGGVIPNPVAPVADFKSNVNCGYAPLTVEFTSLSKGAEWVQWSFGDGTTSRDLNPIHVFKCPGVYKVRLAAVNGDTKSCKAMKIAVGDKKNIKEPLEPVYPPKVTLVCDVSSKPPKLIYTDSDSGMDYLNPRTDDWLNNFPQGPFYMAPNPQREQSNSHKSNHHRFNYGMWYLVFMKQATPIANFSIAPVSAETPLRYQFVDKSINFPFKWKWNFGDGHISYAQNPVHNYQKVGNYKVTLTARNIAGSNTKETTVEVRK